MLGAKLAEIEAALGRCDAILKELQQAATTWPPGMPGSIQRAEEPPSLALQRQRVDDLAGAVLFDRERMKGLDDQLTALRVEQRDLAAEFHGQAYSLADGIQMAAAREQDLREI